MTDRDSRRAAPADEETVPVGTEADEQQDADAVLADAAASADEDALADAGPAAGRRARDGSGATAVSAGTVGGRPERRASLSSRLYNGEAGLDVVGHSKLIYKITAVVVLLCIASMVFRGFNFGIDFAGGNSFRLPGTTEQLVEVREAAEDAGAEVASAQIVGGNTVLLRTEQLDNDDRARRRRGRSPTPPASSRTRSAPSRSAPSGAATSPTRR